MIERISLVLICVLPLLGACAARENFSEEKDSPQFGEAHHRNIAAQLVNPRAPTIGEPMMMNGKRAALAQDRYVKGTVIKPENISIGSNGSNGSSSSSNFGDSGSSSSGGAVTGSVGNN